MLVVGKRILIGFITTLVLFISYAKLSFTRVHMFLSLKAVLMKIDAFHYIQMGTVYR